MPGQYEEACADFFINECCNDGLIDGYEIAIVTVGPEGDLIIGPVRV